MSAEQPPQEILDLLRQQEEIQKKLEVWKRQNPNVPTEEDIKELNASFELDTLVKVPIDKGPEDGMLL